MKTKKIKNTAASVRNRLLNISKDLDIDFNRLLLLYTQERFLFRLKHSKYSENFVLKGGVLFYGVFKQKARPTRDIDFLVSKIENDKDTINKIDKNEIEAKPK